MTQLSVSTVALLLVSALMGAAYTAAPDPGNAPQATLLFRDLCERTDPKSENGKTVAAVVAVTLNGMNPQPQNHKARCRSTSKRLLKRRALDLSHRQLTTIEPLLTLGFLRYLNLSYNSLTEVAALATLTDLQRVDLDGNPIASAFTSFVKSISLAQKRTKGIKRHQNDS